MRCDVWRAGARLPRVVRRRGAGGAAILLAALGLSGTWAQSVRAALPPVPPLPLSPQSIPGAGNPTGDALGDQPQQPVQPCTFQPLGSGEIRTVYTDPPHDEQNPRVATVDPWEPCHLYRVLYSANPPEMERGDVSGGSITWQPVAHGTNGGTQFSDPVISRAGHVFSRTDDVVFSGDEGVHWSLRDGGLTAVPPIYALGPDFAPSDPSTGLLFFGNALRLTHDEGASWQLLPLPVTQPAALEFDPGDASHMYVLDAPENHVGVLWVSTDGGQTWSTLSLPGDVLTSTDIALAFSRLLVTHGATGRDLYVSATGTSGMTSWWRSVDDAASWQPVPVPTAWGGFMAADPTDQRRLIWIGRPTSASTVADVRVTTDDFASIAASRHLNMLANSLQVDRQGDFFVYGGPMNSFVDGIYGQMIAFRLSVFIGTTTARRAPAAPASSSTGAIPLTEVRRCPLPRPSPTMTRDPSGALAFDGRYLDYTYDALTPGVIYRMTTDCRLAPPLRLHPADFPMGQLPTAYELTYDPELTFPDGTPGALLVAGGYAQDPRVPPRQTPIYAVNPLTGLSILLFGLSTDQAGVCGENGQMHNCWGDADPLLSFDIFRHGLWSVGTTSDGQTLAGIYSMAPRFSAGCMSAFADPFFGYGASSQSGGVGGWSVGGENVMYATLESDQMLVRVDDRTCTVLSLYQHRLYSESDDENDQLACDAVTFGGGPRGSDPNHYSVIWLKDSGTPAPVVSTSTLALNDDIAAYQIPDGYCPFPTELRYVGSTRGRPGQRADVCFQLDAETAGTRQPLPGASLLITLAGADLGLATTDSGGVACRQARASAFAGLEAATAHYSGSLAYLPAMASGALAVTAPSLPPRRDGPSLRAALLLPLAITPPPSAPVTQMAPQAQAQGEAETAVQSQVQSVTATQIQPGLMPVRQRQAQAAVQTQLGSPQRVAYQAVRTARRWDLSRLDGAAVTLLFGVALITARSRRALAAARRRR